ncbi:MAG: DUF4388 domain-containing protein [Verrucomicrobiota bacterium]
MGSELDLQRITAKLSVFKPEECEHLLLVSSEEELFETWMQCARQVGSVFFVHQARTIVDAVGIFEGHQFPVVVVSEKLGVDAAVNFICDIRTSDPGVRFCWVGAHDFEPGVMKSLGIVAQCLPQSSRVVVGGILTQLGDRLDSVPLLIGSLETLEFFDFLQMRAQSRRTTAIRFTSTGKEGLIVFAQGTIRFAETGQGSGLDALEDISTWRAGSYKEVTSDPLPPANLKGSAQEILLELAQRCDEKQSRSTA